MTSEGCAAETALGHLLNRIPGKRYLDYSPGLFCTTLASYQARMQISVVVQFESPNLKSGLKSPADHAMLRHA
jgi:hypothetical protein